MLAVLTCSMAHNQIGTLTAPSLHLQSEQRGYSTYSLQKIDSLTQLKNIVQIMEQLCGAHGSTVEKPSARDLARPQP